MARKAASQATSKQEEASSPMTAPQFGYVHQQSQIDPAFVWQQLSEIQRVLGTIQEGQKQLANQLEKVESKLDKVEDRVSGVTHKLYAAGVVLTILVAVGGFVVSKAWDLMATQIVELKK